MSKRNLETCNIQFGKLEIVMNSVNSVPNFKSFYETVPSLTTNEKTKKKAFTNSHKKKTEDIALNEDFQETVLAVDDEIVETKVVPKEQFWNISSQCNNGQEKVVCWWCKICEIEKSMQLSFPSNTTILENSTISEVISVRGNVLELSTSRLTTPIFRIATI